MSESQQSSIVLAQPATIRFPTCCFILKQQSVKGDWCRKKSQNFALFDPLQNLGEVWAEYLSELIKFSLGPNL